MKKVLIISFYWPPSGKASCHWPLHISRHLSSYGWEPVILTVKEDSINRTDSDMIEDKDIRVLRTSFWDPFYLYKKFLGKDRNATIAPSEAISKTNKSLPHRISLWIRMNLFIPDARIGWYPPGLREAKKALKGEKFDALISNGPPHSSHLLGLALSKYLSCPFIPVFIDPWVDISYYKGQKRSELTLRIDNYLERRVMKAADRLVVVTEGLRDYFTNKYPFLAGKTEVLYWGYNEDDFEGLDGIEETAQEEKCIVHAGNIYDFQNPLGLWETLKDQIAQGRTIRLKFIGTVGPLIRSTIKKEGLLPHTEFLGFLPYRKMLQEMIKADYLFLCATERRHVPGKLFEYMRSGRPIIAFGNDNPEVESILRKTGSGMLFKYSERVGKFFSLSKKFKTDLDIVKKFDRKEIAKDLGAVLDKITEGSCKD